MYVLKVFDNVNIIIMAYISQEDKKKLAPAIKAVLKKYGVKGTISVHHKSTLVVTIKSGILDLIGDYNRKIDKDNEYSNGRLTGKSKGSLQLSQYYIDNYALDETVRNLYKELFEAMKGDLWFDKSEPMTDYFNTSYYLDVNVGKWDKPYIFEK